MPEPITQPADWKKLIDSPQRPATDVPPRDPPPVVVHVTRVTLSFENVFDLVFMVFVAQVIIAALIGVVVGAILVYTGAIEF